LQYYTLYKAKPASHFVIAEELRAITEVLGNAYEKLKQLALRASVRKTQLVIFNLSSEIYKYYLESVIQVQASEKRLFYPFKIESYPDEFYVVTLNRQLRKDNTEEIFSECNNIKLEIQKIYNEFFSCSSLMYEQKKLLQDQFKEVVNCFLRLIVKNTPD